MKPIQPEHFVHNSQKRAYELHTSQHYLSVTYSGDDNSWLAEIKEFPADPVDDWKSVFKFKCSDSFVGRHGLCDWLNTHIGGHLLKKLTLDDIKPSAYRYDDDSCTISAVYDGESAIATVWIGAEPHRFEGQTLEGALFMAVNWFNDTYRPDVNQLLERLELAGRTASEIQYGITLRPHHKQIMAALRRLQIWESTRKDTP